MNVRGTCTRALVLTAVFFAALGAQAANACNEPKLAVSPQAAHAGERVSFTIINTEAGATYTVSVGSTQVATGADADGGGVSGSFAMPNLGGSARTVPVAAVVTHEGSDDVHASSPWKSEREIGYLVSAEGGPGRQPADGPAVAPAPSAPAQRPARNPARRARGKTAAGEADSRGPARARAPRQLGRGARPLDRAGTRGLARSAATTSGSKGGLKVFPGSRPAAKRGASDAGGSAAAWGAGAADRDLWSGFAGPAARAAHGGLGASAPQASPSAPALVFAAGLSALALASLVLAATTAAARARRHRANPPR